MKTLAVILTLIVSLLAATLSPPAAHAMPMDDAASISSMSHECCDEEKTSEQYECEDKSSFCQHCEQHCAGQIGLVNLYTSLTSHHFSSSFTQRDLSLWQRSERLIRPPKLMTA